MTGLVTGLVTVWSPTHTERWLLCPMLEHLTREGVVGVREKWSPGMIVGTALHKGFAALMRGQSEEEAIAAVILSLEVTWPSFEAEGWDPTEIREKTVTCLRRTYREQLPNVLHDDGTIVGVEQALGPGDQETGRYPGTTDVVTAHGGLVDRYLSVTDWKSHWTLDDRYVEREQVTTEESWQLYQYAYFAQQYYGLPVRYIRKCVIRVQPVPKSWLYATEVTQEKLTRWHEQAMLVWDQMTNSKPWQNWGSCRRYGRCEYYARCHA